MASMRNCVCTFWGSHQMRRACSSASGTPTPLGRSFGEFWIIGATCVSIRRRGRHLPVWRLLVETARTGFQRIAPSCRVPLSSQFHRRSYPGRSRGSHDAHAPGSRYLRQRAVCDLQGLYRPDLRLGFRCGRSREPESVPQPAINARVRLVGSSLLRNIQMAVRGISNSVDKVTVFWRAIRRAGDNLALLERSATHHLHRFRQSIRPIDALGSNTKFERDSRGHGHIVPRSLSLEGQGRFVVGTHNHQRAPRRRRLRRKHSRSSTLKRD